jgi:hypothetical protein
VPLANVLSRIGLFRSSSSQTLRFAGIVWGDSASTVERKLAAAGFTLAGVDAGDVGFRGRVAGYDGDGWIYFAKRAAVKALFVVRPAPEHLVGTYERMRIVLLREYGQTRHQLASYQAPYARGDGREVEALQGGKLALATAWKDGPDTGDLKADDPGIILRVTRDLKVYLSFEGPGWTAEAARRRAAGIP